MSAHLRLVYSYTHVLPQPEELLGCSGFPRLDHVIHFVLEGPDGILELTLSVRDGRGIILLDSSDELLDLLA